MIVAAVSGKIGRAVARWRWQRRVAREWREVEGSEQLRRFYALVAETAVRGNMLGTYGAGLSGDPRGALLAAQIACATEVARDGEPDADEAAGA